MAADVADASYNYVSVPAARPPEMAGLEGFDADQHGAVNSASIRQFRTASHPPQEVGALWLVDRHRFLSQGDGLN